MVYKGGGGSEAEGFGSVVSEGKRQQVVATARTNEGQ